MPSTNLNHQQRLRSWVLSVLARKQLSGTLTRHSENRFPHFEPDRGCLTRHTSAPSSLLRFFALSRIFPICCFSLHMYFLLGEIPSVTKGVALMGVWPRMLRFAAHIGIGVWRYFSRLNGRTMICCQELSHRYTVRIFQSSLEDRVEHHPMYTQDGWRVRSR